MFKINLQLYLLLMLNAFHYGLTVNYSPYDNKQTHLLQATNANNDGYNNAQQPVSNDYSFLQQNLQGNSNYQQLYRYYYTPPYQQQQQQTLQPHQLAQLWSGPPIVVEEDIQQQYQQSSTNMPPIFYKQDFTGSVGRNSDSELLPFPHRNSKVLPSTVYYPQPTTRTTQFNYNNNNDNIVYHRDFRHQFDAIPDSQHTQQHVASWNNQQQQQKQPQQLYATNTNLRYNGISNGLTTLRKNDVPDYGEHFKRYLENNPRRIKPIY